MTPVVQCPHEKQHSWKIHLFANTFLRLFSVHRSATEDFKSFWETSWYDTLSDGRFLSFEQYSIPVIISKILEISDKPVSLYTVSETACTSTTLTMSGEELHLRIFKALQKLELRRKRSERCFYLPQIILAMVFNCNIYKLFICILNYMLTCRNT